HASAAHVQLTVRGRHERPSGVADGVIALVLAAGAALTYSLTFHPDWIYDPLRYAELMQRGPVRILLGPQHALGNLLPLLVFRAARGVGYGGHAMPVLAGVSVAGAAAAVAAALLLVLAVTSTARARAAGAFVGALAVTAGVIFLVTAGVATGWSLGGMRHWLLHPGIGGSTDRSSLVGWGIGGLFPSVASG